MKETLIPQRPPLTKLALNCFAPEGGELPLPKEVTSPALKAIKGAHTIVRAAFAGCILAIPLASWGGQHRVAGWLSTVVAARSPFWFSTGGAVR